MKVYLTATDYTRALNLHCGAYHYDSVEQLIEYEGEVDYVELTIEELDKLNNPLNNINYN